MSEFNHLKLNSIIAGSGMTQKQLSEKMGVHYNTISAWVNGKAPRPDKLIEVLRLAGVPDDQINQEKLADWYGAS